MKENSNIEQNDLPAAQREAELSLEPTQNRSAAEEKTAISSEKQLSFLRGIWSLFLFFLIGVSLLIVLALNSALLQNGLITLKSPFISASYEVRSSTKSLRQNLKLLEQRLATLKKRLAKMTPLSPYLIVDTSDNYFFVMKGTTLLREGACSTGSYTLLKTENEKQQWIFKTPRGMFRIRNKVRNPIWRMPDWAFVEEGRPIPPVNSPDRFEYGVLGDYGLYLGDGYLIHGTLYQRFLGLAVTHGCVRIGDEDLKFIYKNLPIGSKVFIY